LNSYVAQEKVSFIRLTVRIILKLTVIRIKIFLNRTNTSNWNGWEWRKSVLALLERLGMEEIGFGQTETLGVDKVDFTKTGKRNK
jgi:hypothetical protein